MAQYIGFSTINANKPKTTNNVSGAWAADGDGGPGGIRQGIVWGKKYRLLDTQLVAQDLVNALNIPLGQKVGQPGYGSKVWSFIFEPNTPDVQFQLENEIRRISNLDPRITLNFVKAYPQENGILVEVEMAVSPFNLPLTLSVFFNQASGTAALI